MNPCVQRARTQAFLLSTVLLQCSQYALYGHDSKLCIAIAGPSNNRTIFSAFHAFDVGFVIGGHQFRFENRGDDGAVRGCYGQIDLDNNNNDNDEFVTTVFAADGDGYRVVTPEEARRHNSRVANVKDGKMTFPEPCLQ